VPGVIAAGATINPPLSALPMRPRTYAYRTGEGETPWGAHAADYRTVTPGWFDAVSAQLRAGRFFDARDGWDRSIAVIVDERLAAAAWPGREAVGQAIRVELFRNGRFTPTWAEVVGVIAPMRLDGLVGPERAQLYLAHQQAPQRTMYPAVRLASGARFGAADLQGIVDAIEPGLPVFDVRPAAAHVAEALAPTRFALSVLAVFAAASCLLAGAGVYAAIASVAAARRREVGIRLAMGGTPAHVRRLIMRQGLGWVAGGVGLGAGLALASTRALSSLLHGVAPNDPATLASAAAGLLAIGAAASWVPAFRASRLSPSATLHE
jgi:hypothetical protein